MTEYEARLSRRSPAVLALDDLDVRPTNADGNGFHEDRTFMHIRLRNIFNRAVPGFLGSTVIAFMGKSPFYVLRYFFTDLR